MEWLRSGSSTSEVREFAVAIQGDAEQRHTGLLWRNSMGELRFLHLAWHHRLCDSDPSEDLSWTNVASLGDLAIERFFGNVCARLVKLRPKLSYGFGQGAFDPDTGVFHQDGPCGLTCATFVLAVFGFNGPQLVDRKTWASREDDVLWQRHIIALLKERAPQHAAAIEADIGNCIRIRPEEVAASASRSEIPVVFDVAAPLGEAVVQHLVTITNPAPACPPSG